MSIASKAPPGSIFETLGGKRYLFALRMGEIERFEAEHRGIFAVWEGIYGRGVMPTSQEVLDIICLGLIGGGLNDRQAEKVISGLGPDSLLAMLELATAILGVAFMPDITEKKPQKSKKKK